MHAPLRQPDQNLHRTWRHRDGASYYFDSDRVSELIAQINATGAPAAIDELLTHATPLVKSLIRYRRADRYVPADEILNLVYVKLWRSTRLYDPRRGTAYSFVCKVCESVMLSSIANTWHRNDIYTELDPEIADRLPVYAVDGFALADVISRVRQVKTPCTDCYELEAQRWLIASFLDCEFHIRRHEAADSMSMVYGLGHARSRWLFDMTLLAIRRELINDRRLPPIPPKALLHTKSHALIRYAKHLSSNEFSKLCTLLKDIAPSVIFTVQPKNLAPVRRGEPEAIRTNLHLVLYGSPDDRPLFTQSIPVAKDQGIHAV